MKFKVGQKVRVVKPYSGSNFNDGEIVEIKDISSDEAGNDCYLAISCEVQDEYSWYLYEDEVAPITNGDKIRVMSDDDLAEFLFNAEFDDFSCKFCPHNPVNKGVNSFACTADSSCFDGFKAWLSYACEY